MSLQEAMRSLPSVEKLLKAMAPEEHEPVPRPVVADLVRDEVAALREELQASATPLAEGEALARCKAAVSRFRSSRLQPVINGTGVIIHTNLGRSPLGARQAAALGAIATQYNNLELDLETGNRGRRAGYLERLLATLVGAEAAISVNNCASALVLVLRHLISEEKPVVVVSRGELVEIGGGFRIPEILEASGCTLREVGATNKTTADDYRAAIGPRTALLLKVHRSNFYLGGFTASPAIEELRDLAREHELPLVEDLGSGAVMQTDQLAPIEHEPTPGESIAKGIDLVVFSGDKLLGGPQSGIIAGRSDLVAGVKAEPFFRAVRCDRLILAVLQETVEEYLRAKGGDAGDGDLDIPTIAMIREDPEALRTQAEALAAALGARSSLGVEVVESTARTGGGTMPKSEIPSVALRLTHPERDAESIAARFREGRPAVVGYIEDDRFHLDLRTLFAHQHEVLAAQAEALFPA